MDRIEILLQHLVNGATIGSFYALVALGYTVVYGIIRLINFPHGDLAATGSFIGLSTLTASNALGLSIPVAVLLAFLVSMAVTPLIMLFVLRFLYWPMLRRRASLGLMIVALGVAIALENILQLVYGAAPKAYPAILPSAALALGGVKITYTQIGLFAVSVFLMIALWLFVQRTRTGLAMRALAVDHDAARLVGIDVNTTITAAFMISAALASASGVMIGLYYTQIHFLMGFSLGLKAFTAAVLGGIGNLPGAMLGGLLIGILESLCAGYISGRWQDVVVFGVLIATLLVRPTGLLGERVADRM